MLARHSGTYATALQNNDSKTILNTCLLKRKSPESNMERPCSRLKGGVLFEMMEFFVQTALIF